MWFPRSSISQLLEACWSVCFAQEIIKIAHGSAWHLLKDKKFFPFHYPKEMPLALKLTLITCSWFNYFSYFWKTLMICFCCIHLILFLFVLKNKLAIYFILFISPLMNALSCIINGITHSVVHGRKPGLILA